MSHQLLCCGDATDLATWSNIPYFLLQAGKRHGLFQSGLVLRPERLRWQRRLWNLQQWLRTGRPGGFQYSRWFLSSLWRQAQLPPLPETEPRRLLCHYPLLPPVPWPSPWRVSFYIDATTHQVFKDYGVATRVATQFQRDVIRREQAAYSAAHAVITMSKWAADSVLRDYGISSARVHVVPGGANLDEDALAALPSVQLPSPPSAEQPLRLGFLGKEWQRKGGPFLLQIAEVLEKQGVPTVVRAIGPDPLQLPSHPQLHPLGFINKKTQMPAFAQEVKSWHFGTLFSSIEAFGISNRECLRLGVPVLAAGIGGIPATIPDQGCGELFAADASPQLVADWIIRRISPYHDFLNWRDSLLKRSEEFSWSSTVRRLDEILYLP